MKPPDEFDRAMLARALWARETEVFLDRRIDSAVVDLHHPQTPSWAVTIRFNTQIEAEEFHKLLLAQKGRAGK